MRRPRPLTAHQLAVERNRNQRVDYILSRGLRKTHHIVRKKRKQEGAFFRAMNRASKVDDAFEDSEGEESYMRAPGPFRTRGFVGLVQLEAEDDDFGEEVAAYAAAFRRMGRRLERWDSQKHLNLGVMGTNRVAQAIDRNGDSVGRDNDETEDEKPPGGYNEPKQNSNGDVNMDDEEDLDDMEKELLGLGSGEDEEAEAEEDLDDVDKELLGLGGDETEDEGSAMEVD
jgi:Ino eighty subunit 1